MNTTTHQHAHDITRDPVCGMEVDPHADKPTHEHDGRTYHFCAARCRDRFVAAPLDYIEATDPVCGMAVNRADARHLAKHDGQRYYFCSARCREKFTAEPASYLTGKPAPQPMPDGTVYTCPMHPQIQQLGPGDCPLCGMALEPAGIPAADDEPNPELVDFKRRFLVGALLSVPILVLAMGPMLGLPVREWIGERVATWAELVLATPVRYPGRSWPDPRAGA
jgi:Cu+-exporting ATPase